MCRAWGLGQLRKVYGAQLDFYVLVDLEGVRLEVSGLSKICEIWGAELPRHDFRPVWGCELGQRLKAWSFGDRRPVGSGFRGFQNTSGIEFPALRLSQHTTGLPALPYMEFS